ncbi:MAG: bifunctional 2-C-methyl-D-erythritol 4-phosphate cytidylyltransferase/2-C-methyl-D-erythritol 2,4-cyclodiphosphate synthase [Rhizobiaceae bacterium]|nr:bifunctional 2-C-methyl-D-erythritol 4-phosphate cytidylyltransferase/2-C-methyl-D-erythritol 2,4-cyclodiphosphate synthase [Rhizobiaceae bacterium]
MNNKTLAIIVAGGRSSRLSGNVELPRADRDVPKQYMMLAGRSVLERCVDKFISHSQIDNVLVVIHRDDIAAYDRHVRPHSKLLPAVTGGSSRQQSVYKGLMEAKIMGPGGKILIHDGARPFVESETITQVLDNIAPAIGAIAANRVVDTLKRGDSRLEISATVSRDDLFCAQTPQGFMAKDIIAVHEDANKNEKSDFTDDASMFEAAGLAVRMVVSPSHNFKITTPDDLARARSLVEQIEGLPMTHADIRSGNGYDVHAFAAGDGVILCGHKIPFHKKLEGHSDADVALHALTDALLGTIGAGDIGSHFPPSDPQWKGVSSDRFVKHAIELVADKGGMINNVDITLICEAPKIGPHRDNMREKLAELCDLELDRVSLKATTNEKLGFIGREEGIAAIATVAVSFGARS